MVLHLYNALKDVGLAPVDGQGFLESLDKIFENSKTVWKGAKPTRGRFVLSWWFAFGRAFENAKQYSDMAAATFGGVRRTVSRSRRQEAPRRMMIRVEPGDSSKSYRRIVSGDFSDVVDMCHKTVDQKSRSLYDHAMRCEAAKAAIYEDKSYLAMNLTALGAHLNKFIEEFFHKYWNKELKFLVGMALDTVCYGTRPGGKPVPRQSFETGEDNLERQVMVSIIGEQILGRLDFLDLSKPNPVVEQLVSFMTVYFNQLDPRLIMYFTPTELS